MPCSDSLWAAAYGRCCMYKTLAFEMAYTAWENLFFFISPYRPWDCHRMDLLWDSDDSTINLQSEELEKKTRLGATKFLAPTRGLNRECSSSIQHNYRNTQKRERWSRLGCLLGTGRVLHQLQSSDSFFFLPVNCWPGFLIFRFLSV